MNKSLLIVGCLLGGSLYGQTIVKDTLFFTGSEQIWTVPCGASNVFVDAFGASGAAGSSINPGVNTGGAAGLGNHVSGSFSFLNPNDNLYVYVGGKANNQVGGYNGGGAGAVGNLTNGTNHSGGGGGATDIRFGGNAINNRVLVAGGGGGGGNAGLHGLGGDFTGGNGGNGGGNQMQEGNSLNGGNGLPTTETSTGYVSGGSTGGSSSGVGLPGEGCASFLGQAGLPGVLGQGGDGGFGNSGFGQAQSLMAPNGGGGGGGYVGGNGGGGGSAGDTGCNGNVFGAGGGGAAGSNYFDGPIAGINGVNDGNGYVVFTYTLETPIVEIDENFEVPCVGEEIIIYGNPGNGTWTTIQGNPNDMFDGMFTPSQEGSYTLVYSKTICNTVFADTINLEVNCTVGLNENHMALFILYPNPSEDNITIDNAHLATISIHDLSGKELISISNYNGEAIDTTKLASGIYTVTVTNESGSSSARMIKQ